MGGGCTMRRAVSVFIAAALLIGALSFQGDTAGRLFCASDFQLKAAAEAAASTSAPVAGAGEFNWNGVWRYSAAEQWNVGSNNPLAGAAVYKTVNVTETITITPYTQMEGFTNKVVWHTTNDDGEKVEEGGNGIPRPRQSLGCFLRGGTRRQDRARHASLRRNERRL